MSWPVAFSWVGGIWGTAAMVWAFCWMAVRIAQANNRLLETMEKTK